MTRAWFSDELETVAIFWRILRRDGVALGFATHDKDIWIDGVLHLASPGMVPSAIRKSADFTPDSAEVQGALTHEAINARDLAAGRFDNATVLIGLVDWETGERDVIYRGRIGPVSEEAGRFSAELASRKAELQRDPTPRTSPACRAAFCGPGCNLNPEAFTREARVSVINHDENALTFDDIGDASPYLAGEIRWVDGPHAGGVMSVIATTGLGKMIVDAPLDAGVDVAMAVRLREGCDHTLDTCATRFGNAVNFRGEPFLPGNDLLTRYPTPPG